MVRNSERAISVGPRKLGLFCWWCLIDQRVSIWTTLIGPTAAAYMLFVRDRADLVAAYFLWVICSRTVRSLPSWMHGRRVSFLYAPLAVLFDWTGALVKIWVMFFPAKQFWLNRGARELDSTRGRSRARDRRIVSGVLMASAMTGYVFAVAALVGTVPIVRDTALIATQLESQRLAVWTAAACIAALTAFVLVRIRDRAPSASEQGGGS
jgi:glycosyltransferase Alg8